MKIALLSSPWISIPPIGYGGTELVVYNLAQTLVEKGHDVTVFATGDSKTNAKLRYYFEKALGNDITFKLNQYNFLFHIHAFFKMVQEEKFDIVHNNVGQPAMFFADLASVPVIHTIHGGIYKDLQAPSGFMDDKRKAMIQFKDHAFVSISDQQREGIPELNYVKTVYNGIDIKDFQLNENQGKYVAWLGRITYNKGVDTVIKVAKKVGMKLRLAAYIDEVDREYYTKEIEPLLDDNVEFIGEIKNNEEKNAFLGNAYTTLFPIRWHEPFGLVMIESLITGTPVIAFNKGSVPEIIKDKETGFIVETEEEMVEAFGKVKNISRKICHDDVVERFSIDAMASNYLEAYQIAINQFKNT